MRISCCNKINQNTVPNKNIHENHMNKDINEEEEEKKKNRAGTWCTSQKRK